VGVQAYHRGNWFQIGRDSISMAIQLRCSCATIPQGLVKVCFRCGRRDRIDGFREAEQFDWKD